MLTSPSPHWTNYATRCTTAVNHLSETFNNLELCSARILPRTCHWYFPFASARYLQIMQPAQSHSQTLTSVSGSSRGWGPYVYRQSWCILLVLSQLIRLSPTGSSTSRFFSVSECFSICWSSASLLIVTTAFTVIWLTHTTCCTWLTNLRFRQLTLSPSAMQLHET